MSKETIRSREAILADISVIKYTVEGKLTEMRRVLKGGEKAVYYHIQCWDNGRNKTIYVPTNKIEEVRLGIENRKRLEALLHELAEADTLSILSGRQEDASKKKQKKSCGNIRTRFAGK